MKYLFYVSDSGVDVYQDVWTEGDVRQKFTWEEVEQLDEFLGTIEEKARAEVVLDLIDEDLYFEWAPKVMPWEKPAIIKRREHRLQTENTVLTEVRWTGVVQDSEDGRKEELLMAATISDTFNIHSFLDSLQQAQIILTAIHSKAFLLEEYFTQWARPYLKLSKSDTLKPFLLISRQSENIYRQTFFHDGDLRLSRLVELDKSLTDLDEIRQALMDEIKLAITYVYNQKIVPFTSPIGYVFLDNDPAMLDNFSEVCRKNGLIRDNWEADQFFVVSAQFSDLVPRKAITTTTNSTSCSPEAIVDFVFTAQPKGFYQLPYVDKINHILLSRKILVSLNIVVFLGGLYYLVVSGVDTLVSWQKQTMLEQSIKEHQSEIKRLEAMVKLQDDAKKIKASVEFSEAILKLKVDRLISFDIEAFSQVFANNPRIQLSSLDWRNAERFDSGSNQLEMQAWVAPFYETYRKPVEWVDEFVAELAQVAGVEMVELQKEPLNRRLNQGLKVNTDAGDTRALPFTVTVRVRDVKSN